MFPEAGRVGRQFWRGMVAAMLMLASGGVTLAQQSAEGSLGLAAVSLRQYRQWVAAAHAASAGQPRKGAPVPPPVDLRPADAAFLRVLILQARVDSARQSLDRLAGWNRAIRPRIENQSIAALEVEILSWAEKKAISQVARLESELRAAVHQANAIAGRAPESALVAAVNAAAISPEDTAALAAAERDVLVSGRELLMKMFQSFTVGGADAAELLWQESQAAEAEANYRMWAARAGFEAAAAADSGPVR